MTTAPAPLAEADPLIHLRDRASWRRLASAALAAGAAQHEAAAVIVVDLDRFRAVNEALGYEAGDRVLHAVVQRLAREAGREAVLGRLGGDSFALLLGGLQARRAAARAEALAWRLHHALAEPVLVGGIPVDTQASIGWAWGLAATGDADLLLYRAEAAMYEAKRRREGPRAHQATPTRSAAAPTVSLLGELRRAVDAGELRLHLQPQRSLRSGRIAGAEALMRWQHPSRGLLPPREFIPFAERSGFVRELTLWALDASARAWKQIAATGRRFVLALNLSVHDLHDDTLAAKFAAVLQRHGVPARAFCLEITEGALMDDPALALATLQQLRALGFRLAIDDFGTGHSSFSRLRQFPVQALKIDQSFVLGLAEDENAARIVRSIIRLAHGLGLRVVAEGVESEAACALLRASGCDGVQGLHVGEPLPVAQFAAGALALPAVASL